MMIVQNNYSALAFLAIVILTGAVLLGFLLMPTEVFNPAQARQIADANATKSALDARERVGILQATETPRALHVAAIQTHQVAIAQATAIPVQQTATQVAVQSALSVARANATQTAIAVGAHNAVLQAQATQTRIAQEQAMNALNAQATTTAVALASARDNDKRHNENAREIALTLAMAVALIAIAVGGAALGVANANAKANAAAALLEREKRRTLQVQAAVRATPTNVIPLPAARVPKNGHDEEKIAA